MTIRWPCDVLIARNVSFDIAPRTLAGPTSVSGKTQTVSTDAGIWKVTLGAIVIRDRQTRLAFRAFANLLEGRLNPILVPRCRADQPVPSGAVAAGLYDQIPHSDDTLFDDDSGYSQTVIDVEASSGASARAVSMAITINYAGTIEPGMDFSVGERMYRVRSVVYASASSATITFRPPLREAVSAGAVLNFDDPVCRMRLVSDDQMDLELQMRRFGSPTVQFVEDV